MGFSAHLRPEGERYSHTFYNGQAAKTKKFNEIEDIINQIACDIVNGVQRSDILIKLQKAIYDGQTKKYTERTSENIYQVAMQRLKQDREKDMDDLKDKLYSQYYQLYQDAMEVGNTIGAKAVLDSIAKVFIGENKNVSLNGNLNEDKNVTIRFGFSNKDDIEK